MIPGGLHIVRRVAIARRLRGKCRGLRHLRRGPLIEVLAGFLRSGRPLGECLSSGVGLLGLRLAGLSGLLLRRIGHPLAHEAGLIVPGLGPGGRAVHGIGGLIGKHGHGLGRQQIHAMARYLGNGSGEGIAGAA